MTNSTGPDPLSPEGRRVVLREHLEREKERRHAAEAKVAALEAALRKHMQWFKDEKGAKVCGGCLEPAPCPDAALAGEEPQP